MARSLVKLAPHEWSRLVTRSSPARTSSAADARLFVTLRNARASSVRMQCMHKRAWQSCRDELLLSEA